MNIPFQFPIQNSALAFPQNLLRQYRNRCELSQDKLARLIGLSSSRMIQNWEGGFLLPKADRLRHLLEAFVVHRAFTTGQELHEARILWQAVKSMYETTAETFRSYPPFDPEWFQKILTNNTNSNINASRSGSLKLVPTRLPVKIANHHPWQVRLLGREHEIAQIESFLLENKVRLLTINGIGGIGKTRLAQELCSLLGNRYSDGTFFIPLAALDSRETLLAELAKALLLPRTDETESLLEQLKKFVAEKELLLVLDNFEQLMDCVSLLEELLLAAPGLQLLITSREILRLPLEHKYNLNPLKAELAATLFEEKAKLTNPQFEPGEHNHDAVDSICARLEYLPLAIELAAGRTTLLTPAQILQRLNNLFNLLTSTEPAYSDRQKTLFNTLEWSFDLLEPVEQTLFCRLALFSGSFTVEAVEFIAGFDNPKVLDGLESLLRKNLLQSSIIKQGEIRCHMLQLVHEYALEKLNQTAENLLIKERFIEYFLNLVEESEPKLQGVDQKQVLDRLEEEYPNIRETVRIALHKQDQLDKAERITGGLWRFWWARGYVAEGRGYLEGLLANHTPPRPASLSLAKALNAAGNLADIQGDFPAALTYFEQSLATYQTLEDKTGMAKVLNNQGNIHSVLGEYRLAQNKLEQSLALYQQLADWNGMAMTLVNLGRIFRIMGDTESSLRNYEETCTICRKTGDFGTLAQTLSNLSNLTLSTNNFEQAEKYAQESLELSHRIGNKGLEIYALQSLGRAAFEKADFLSAISYYEAGLKTCREVQDRLQTAVTLDGLGRALIETGDLNQAQLFIEESLAIFVETGSKQGQLAAFVSQASLAYRQENPEKAHKILNQIEMLEKSWATPLEPLELNYLLKVKNALNPTQ